MLKCVAEGMERVTMTIENPSEEIWAQVEAGTLIAPQANSRSQTLISKKDHSICLPKG